MLDAIGFAASTSDCTAETEIEDIYRGYTFSEDEPAVRLAAEGLRRAGYEPTTAFSGGGADANVFNERGLPCVNLANGMSRHPHGRRADRRRRSRRAWSR